MQNVLSYIKSGNCVNIIHNILINKYIRPEGNRSQDYEIKRFCSYGEFFGSSSQYTKPLNCQKSVTDLGSRVILYYKALN